MFNVWKGEGPEPATDCHAFDRRAAHVPRPRGRVACFCNGMHPRDRRHNVDETAFKFGICN